MKVELAYYTCGCCECKFTAHKLIAGSYGEFLLRSAGTGQEAYLNAMADDTYMEVNNILASLPQMMNVKPIVKAGYLKSIYGLVACDTDNNGYPFEIGLNPKCPRCSSREIKFWEVVEPIEVIDKDIPFVTHFRWNKLSREDKIILVTESLSKILSGT